MCLCVNVDLAAVFGWVPQSHWLAGSFLGEKKSDAPVRSLWYAHLHLLSASPPPSFCDLAKGRGYGGTALRPAPAQEVNALVCAHMSLWRLSKVHQAHMANRVQRCVRKPFQRSYTFGGDRHAWAHWLIFQLPCGGVSMNYEQFSLPSVSRS